MLSSVLWLNLFRRLCVSLIMLFAQQEIDINDPSCPHTQFSTTSSLISKMVVSQTFRLVARRWLTTRMPVVCPQTKLLRNCVLKELLVPSLNHTSSNSNGFHPIKEAVPQGQLKKIEVRLLKDSTTHKEKNSDERDPKSLEKERVPEEGEKAPDNKAEKEESKALIPYPGWPILVLEKTRRLEMQMFLFNNLKLFNVCEWRGSAGLSRVPGRVASTGRVGFEYWDPAPERQTRPLKSA
ncbi:hypothetical protein EV360DRAFT_76407 [Lentinula raphanica]|nr:hypothetical protein EV360DRAFT_76407 [Lentinula raphanica]